MDLYLLVIPVIGALIGWVTNYLAVKMLFHPRKPVSLLLVTIQGVFPKRQEAFATKLGGIVSEELFSADDVKKVLSQGVQSDKLTAAIDTQLDVVIAQKLPAAIPMLAMVINPELVRVVKGAFMSELQPMLTAVVDALSENLDEALDVHAVVEEKVRNFSSDKLEEILFAIMKKEFKFIEFVGAFLGFCIGLVQVLLVQYQKEIIDLLGM